MSKRALAAMHYSRSKNGSLTMAGHNLVQCRVQRKPIHFYRPVQTWNFRRVQVETSQMKAFSSFWFCLVPVGTGHCHTKIFDKMGRKMIEE